MRVRVRVRMRVRVRVSKTGSDPNPNPNPNQVSHHVDKLVFGAINEAGRLKHVMPIEERSSLFSTSFMMHQVRRYRRDIGEMHQLHDAPGDPSCVRARARGRGRGRGRGIMHPG